MLISRLLVGLFVGLVLAVPAQADEQVVRMAFRDTPILIKIARCESDFRQFDKNGKVLKNLEGSSATGVMQIMASVHEKTARKLGYNIRTLDGNLKYAKWLYQNEGTTPWKSSRGCWKKTA